MAVPKRRTSSATRRMRRSHDAKKGIKLVTCERCRAFKLPHQACRNCGTYAGREVIDVLAKLDKKEKKAKQQELKEAGK